MPRILGRCSWLLAALVAALLAALWLLEPVAQGCEQHSLQGINDGRPLNFETTPAECFFSGDNLSYWAQAIGRPDLDLAKKLIESGQNVDVSGAYGMTALFLAVLRGQFSLAQLLLDNGASPNVILDNGLGLIEVAARNGDIEMLELLVEHGANLNVPSGMQFPKTPIFHAMGLQSEGEPNEKMIRLLVRNGADVNYLAESGQRPAHWAVKKGQFHLATLLLNLGADPSLRDGSGDDLLAVIKKKERVLKKGTRLHESLTRLASLIESGGYDER